MNGNPPYQGPYAPPGQGAPVHAPYQQQQPPQGYQAPQQQGYPPAGGVYPPQQGQPPYGPPQGFQQPPPQQQPVYPQGPPQQPPGQQWAPGYSAMDPAMKAELEREEAELKSRRGDVDYYKPKQPANRGDTAESVVRFLPAWPGKATASFWHRVYQHYVTADFQGKRVRIPIPCAREMSAANYPGQQPMPCAACERREYLERIGNKKDADQLDFKSRFYANVLDAENQQRHWVADPASGGQLMPVAAVYPIGPGLFRKLGAIMHARGDIAHMQTGRLIKIMITKTGGEARDVRYDAIDFDAQPVFPGFEAIRLVDLAQLDRMRDYQEVCGWLDQQYGPMQQQPQGGRVYVPPQYQQGPQGQPQGQYQQQGYPATGQPYVQSQGQPQYQQAPQPQGQPQYGPPPQQAAPPPPQQFQSQWTGTMCSVCGQPQFTSPGGNTCQNGHGGAAPAQAQVQGQQYQVPPQQGAQQAAPPQQQYQQQAPPQQQYQQQAAPPQQQAAPPAQAPGEDDQIPF